LLQISADERARAGRVAELFGEEDLARFLQILLRTHADVGYKQEQRFHLELGLLKLVHAQRLLPMEQLLSGAAPPPQEPKRIPPGTPPAARPGPGAQRGAPPEAPPSRGTSSARSVVSPFSSDLARKTTPSSDASAAAGWSAAAVAPAPEPEARPAEAAPLSETEVAGRVIAAAEDAGCNDLANLLRGGQWKIDGNNVLVEVPDPPVLVQMALNRKEAAQLLDAAASAALGQRAYLKIVSGGEAAGAPLSPRPRNGISQKKVAEEPVIRRLQEKFGAEIRSIVDFRDKD
jgi:DNA polymerase-3 subunit gamma/tau